MSSPTYYAPTFFSPYYFSPLVSTRVVVPPPPSAGYRDRDAFAAIVDALAATGEFSDVVVGGAVDQEPPRGARDPLAMIVPGGWTETDEFDPCLLVRRVEFHAVLAVRDEEPADRFERLDRLASVVTNALDGADLGGCLPALTIVRQGRFDPGSKHPEQRLVLSGEFSYFIASFSSHDVTY